MTCVMALQVKTSDFGQYFTNDLELHVLKYLMARLKWSQRKAGGCLFSFNHYLVRDL